MTYPNIFDSIPSLPYILTLTVLLRYLIFPAFKLQFLRYKGLYTLYYPPIVYQRHWNSSIKTKAGRHQRLMFPNQKALAANCGRNIIFVLYDCEYKNLFLQNQNCYKKTDSIDFIKPLLNSGLISPQQKDFPRNTALPELNVNFIHITVQNLLNSIPESTYKKFPLVKNIEELAGETIALLYFGENLHNYTFEGKPVSLALAELVKQISNSSTRPIGQLLGDRVANRMPHYRTLKRKVQNMRQLLLKIIEEKMVQPQQIGSESTIKEPVLTNEEILNQFMTYFIDAISTTNHLVCISLYNLIQYPEYLEKLKEERQTLFAGRKNNEITTIETLKKMEVLHSFFQETLRFYPAAPNILARVATKNHKLADLTIRKGDQVRVDMLASFFDEKFFEDSLRFDPDRWRRSKQKLDPFTYTPFFGGNKSCTGQNMVIMMGKVIISEFLNKFNYTLITDCRNLIHSPHENLNDIFFNLSKTG